MGEFTFNGVSATNLRLTIAHMPQGGRGMQRYTAASVPGRDGSLYRAETAFEDYEDEIVINCNNRDARVVKNWLKGAGWSITSDYPDKRRYVRFYKELQIERWRPSRSNADIITAPMICDPFQYDALDPAISLSNGQEVTGEGDWYARPLIAVSGRGDIALAVNNTTYAITLSSSVTQTLWIDTDAKTAYTLVEGVPQSAALAGISLTLTSDDPDTRWGRLEYSGTNIISWSETNVAGVSMRPRWRWF